MALTSAQITAFKVASGDVDLNVVHLTSVGMLVAVLFLWAAWGLSDAWSGWRNGDV
ncbi:TIGR03758 family integrating conjugative element protein, partial [Escherichia coli]|nr:TIGR03758 family integrating conjugative element protein [Escherichia coli]